MLKTKQKAAVFLVIMQCILLLGFISVQISFSGPQAIRPALTMPAPPAIGKLHMPTLGEPQILAKLIGFWLLSFDSRSGTIIDYEDLNYGYLTGWLEVIQTLDPRSDYPSQMAVGVFVETKEPKQIRQVIQFVHKQFLQSPADRWRWQAYATMQAKYRLKDLELALELARDLRKYGARHKIPAWAQDMEFLLLQALGEYEAARLVILAMLESGAITDPNELKFLNSKLEQLIKQTQ